MELQALKIDETVYPREKINVDHVLAITEAIEAGATFPPLVACEATQRIVDGVHRYTAYFRKFGPSYVVDVAEKRYRDDRELFLDSIRLNAKHGLPLTQKDRKSCSLVASRFGISADELSVSINIGVLKSTVPKTAALKTKVKQRRHDGPVRQFSEMGESNLTERQQQDVANSMEGWQERLAVIRAAKQSGDELGFHVDWLIRFCDSHKLDGDEETALLRLMKSLKKKLPQG